MEAAASIGTCEKCYGALCVSGGKVECERCGHNHLDHPMLKVPATGMAKLPDPVEIRHEDNQASWIERIAALEKRCVALEHKVAQLLKQQSKK